MSALTNPTTLALALHILVVVGITIHIIMGKPQTGVALAWLFLVTLLPVVGFVYYILSWGATHQRPTFTPPGAIERCPPYIR